MRYYNDANIEFVIIVYQTSSPRFVTSISNLMGAVSGVWSIASIKKKMIKERFKAYEIYKQDALRDRKTLPRLDGVKQSSQAQ